MKSFFRLLLSILNLLFRTFIQCTKGHKIESEASDGLKQDDENIIGGTKHE